MVKTRAMVRNTYPLFARLALRQMRGGLKGFRVLMACIILGVAAIAGVGSLADALLDGLHENGRVILGGEVEVRQLHRPASQEELDWLQETSEGLSKAAELRTMIRGTGSAGERFLIELKAVDESYPLFGEAVVEGTPTLQKALEKKDNVPGVAVDPSVLQRLGIQIGDSVQIGETIFRVRAAVLGEPDRAAEGLMFGPRVFMSYEAFHETGLVQPGSLIHYQYNLHLPPTTTVESWRQAVQEDFPNAGWRIRDLENAAPNIQRFVERVALFMTLVGLTTLVVGGIGISNSVRAFVTEKTEDIATMKALGAESDLVYRVFLTQIFIVASLAIFLGLALGAIIPTLAAPILERLLNFPVEGAQLFGQKLLSAAVFGYLIVPVFALWPLSQIQSISPALLFRMAVSGHGGGVAFKFVLWSFLAAAILAGFAIATASDTFLAVLFIGAVLLALLLFRLLAYAVISLSRRLPQLKKPLLRLAITNLHRPGAPTLQLIVSIGLGLSVLVAISLIRANLSQQVTQDIPASAPNFYFIDIQPDQIESFTQDAKNFEGVRDFASVPMLRGRITAVNGIAPDQLTIPNDIAWIFNGDRGLTWSRQPPANATITKGSWWSPDYRGDPLVSLAAEVGEKMNLDIGDTLTINILGRDIEVSIANFRRITWEELSINFVMIFSPGLLEQAPQTHIATVEVDREREDALERMLTDRYPNVSSIRVREALTTISDMLEKIGAALAATAGITLLAGVFVLSGAFAAEHHRRIYDSIILKVLGATRPAVAGVYALEYGILGLVASLLAVVVGSAAAYGVVVYIMDLSFSWMPLVAILTALPAVLVTLIFGLLGTWFALSQKAAPLLRNE